MKPVKPTNGTPAPARTPQVAATPTTHAGIKRGRLSCSHKIVIYGPGGVGKTELASLADGNVLFIDLEDGSKFLDVSRVDPAPQTFADLLGAVRMAAESPDVDVIVVDSFTKAEELGVAHTLATVKHEKGHSVDSIEGYGFGKGYVHVFETFLMLLQALDAAARRGKHIIGIAHDCTANVPNPAGEDWIRYEPRLQSPPSGKGSIRHRVKEWCDHLFYVGFDSFSKDGKAQGSGTRTIYSTELPTHWAKSRVLSDDVVYERGDASLWQQLFNKA
jgi:hypothetical protein